MANRKLSCTALMQGSVANVLLGKIFLQQQIEMREKSRVASLAKGLLWLENNAQAAQGSIRKAASRNVAALLILQGVPNRMHQECIEQPV